MERVEYQEPPPKWTSVVVTWDDIMNHPHYNIREILAWVETTPGCRYHLHGHESTAGFDFRFENPKDATYFKLKWL